MPSLASKIAHYAVLGVETLLRHVAALYQRDYGQTELLCKGVVPAVMGGNRHDGSGAVAREHVFGNPDGHLLPVQGVDAVGAGEDSGHALRLGNPLALGLLSRGPDILLHLFAPVLGGQLGNQLALGSEHHEGDAEDRVGPGGEYSDGQVPAVADRVENHLRSLGAAYPVALHLLEGVAPVEGVEGVEQPFGVGGDPELPLGHLLLLHGIAAAHAQAVLDLVVGEHGAQALAPVHAGLTLICYAVAHQDVRLLLFGGGGPLRRSHVAVALGSDLLNQFRNGSGLVQAGVIPTVEHLEEGPLRPFVERRIAGAHLPVPVVGEAYAVELAAVALDIAGGGDFGVLAGLDGILLGGKAEGVVSHGVQHVEALEPLVSGEDVAGDVAERMTDVQPRA